MSVRTARAMLAIGMLLGFVLDGMAAYAWWAGKPWHVIVGMLVVGALVHPGAQPTIRRYADADKVTA